MDHWTAASLPDAGCCPCVAPPCARVGPPWSPLQMAYLALNGLVQVVMTEDSDLLCYGCPTVSE